jgi:hypothetical protein
MRIPAELCSGWTDRPYDGACDGPAGPQLVPRRQTRTRCLARHALAFGLFAVLGFGDLGFGVEGSGFFESYRFLGSELTSDHGSEAPAQDHCISVFPLWQRCEGFCPEFIARSVGRQHRTTGGICLSFVAAATKGLAPSSFSQSKSEMRHGNGVHGTMEHPVRKQ